MPIDERLRAGLPMALDDVRPDVDAELGRLLDRARRRSRVRRASYGLGLVAATLVVAVALGLGSDNTRGSEAPAAPGGEVSVLDSGRGSPVDLAPLEPGRYVYPFIGAPDRAPWGQVEVPPGWSQDRLLLATALDPDPHLRRVELVTVDRVAPDPCGGSMESVPARVPAIVKALTQQRTTQPSAPRPVTIDGYSGQLVSFQVPAGLDVADCWNGAGELRPYAAGSGWTSVFPGWTYRVWVLDVEGDPLLVMAAHGAQTTPAELAELTDMVEGLTFVAPR
jgi:hypothetical protein